MGRLHCLRSDDWHGLPIDCARRQAVGHRSSCGRHASSCQFWFGERCWPSVHSRDGGKRRLCSRWMGYSTPTRRGWRRGRDLDTTQGLQGLQKGKQSTPTGRFTSSRRSRTLTNLFRPSTFSTWIGSNGWSRMERARQTSPPLSRRSFTRSGGRFGGFGPQTHRHGRRQPSVV